MNRPEEVASNDFAYSGAALTPALIQATSSDSSSAPTRKNPPAASFKPHPLLYPLKESHSDGPPKQKWVGLTPLDMIQQICSLAEKSPKAAESSSSLLAFLARHESRSTDAHAGGKRKSNHISEGTLDVGTDDGTAAALVESYRDMQLTGGELKGWDSPSKTVRLEGLAQDFERIVAADPKLAWSIPSYNRVQQAFASHATDPKARLAAAKQLEVLLAMVSVEEPKKTSTTRELSSAISLLSLERSVATTRAPGQLVQNAARPLVGNTFQDVMVSWLVSFLLFDHMI